MFFRCGLVRRRDIRAASKRKSNNLRAEVVGIAIALSVVGKKFKRFLVHSRTVHARVFAKATRED
jgi:hypothetical protein